MANIRLPFILSILIALVVIRSFTLLPADESSQTSSPGRGREDTTRLRNSSFVFVHVGKTGGETIKWRLKVSCKLRLSLRKRDRCYEQFKSGESRLSNATIGYLHCDKLRPKGSHQNSTAYLFSTRDPIDRIVSWFQYMHPKNCLPDFPSGACNLKKGNNSWGFHFYQVCFPDVNDMFRSMDSPLMVGSTNCTQLALDTVQGRGPEGASNHMYYNYFYYANRTSLLHPERDIVVVRKENLWEDLKKLEELLGGTKSRQFESEGPVITHGNEKFVYQAALNPMYIPSMCCAIASEISVYATILARAKNLDGVNKMYSIQSLLEKCRIESLHSLATRCGQQTISRT